MRIRLPLRRTVFFLAVFFFALVALVPLRVAIGWFGADGRGLAAREASGSLWLGVLKEAQFGPVAARRRQGAPQRPAAAPRPRPAVAGAGGGGRPPRRRGQRVAPQLRPRRSHRPAPRRRRCSRRCRSRRSTSTTSARISPAGSARAPGAGSAPACRARSPASPFRRACAAMRAAPRARCSSRLPASRAWSSSTFASAPTAATGSTWSCRPSDPALGGRLAAAGFALTQSGYVRRLDGSF